MAAQVLRAGVFGATGYVGRELLRLVAGHPRLELAFATGSGEGRLAHEAGLEREADAYFLALPHGVSGGYAARLAEARPEARVVDLSGDLRLPSPEAYRAWYGHEPAAPERLGATPYGLTEIYRARLGAAHLVANPGCYATSVLLPLVPLLRADLVAAEDVLVDAKSGATGAGRAPNEDLLFCEVADDLKAYSPGRSHRHVGEIEAVVRETTGRELALSFCPHLLPVRRGILSALYLRTRRSVPELVGSLREAYAGSSFVHVVDSPPRLRDVVETNRCHLSVHDAAPGRVVVFSALDNLLKGAAGQAVQNLNVALGWPEELGLLAGADLRRDPIPPPKRGGIGWGVDE